MALTLVDLLGETVLVACDQNINEHHTHLSQENHLRNSTPQTKHCDASKCSGSENLELEKVNEEKKDSDIEESRITDDRDRRKISSDVDNTDEEQYNLVTKDGVVLDIVNVEQLIAPEVTIGLYFASSTIPEYRSFTDHLLSLHTQLSGRLSVVLVAGDEACYRQCLATTTFYCVPYHYCNIRRRLCRRYRVSSLASLILVDSRTARLISRPSLETLQTDTQGLKFPWRPRALKELLQCVELVDNAGRSVDYNTIRNGYKALYFSAHWCPPCKVFTPQLMETYRRIKENGHALEVIFVSSDRSCASYESYRSSMPWPSVTWTSDRRELAAALQVEDIPRLVLLGPDNSPLTHHGRGHVTKDPEGQEFPWRDQSVELLDDRQMATLQERPCLIIFADGEDGCSEQELYQELLLPVAEEYLLHRVPTDGDSVAFMVAADGELSESLRGACSLEDFAPLVCILDLSEGVKFLMEEGQDISTASLHAFLTRYTRQELTPIAVSPPQEEEKETTNVL